MLSFRTLKTAATASFAALLLTFSVSGCVVHHGYQPSYGYAYVRPYAPPPAYWRHDYGRRDHGWREHRGDGPRNHGWDDDGRRRNH